MSQSLALDGAKRVKASWLDALARKLVRRSLARLEQGSLAVLESGERIVFGEGEPQATVRVHRPEGYRYVAFGGTLGAGRAYVDGAWSTDDLPALIRLFALNRNALFGLEGGLARLSRPFTWAAHVARRNTHEGSRRNISAHYDLGNDFYRLFLDDTLAYSCGIFDSEARSLKEASLAKFERIAEKLRLSPEDHLLEIGTGWGGLAIHVAKTTGCRVTTTTISQEQYDFARARVKEEGLEERVRIVKKDYRDLDGRYDKIVSVEMIEAVGFEFFDKFFDTCDRLLTDDGSLLLQSITITDQEFERHRREVDFIKRYVFPGSCIPSVTALLSSATRASRLRLLDLEDITHHYVTTIKRWRKAFHDRLDSVRAQSFSERFIRTWDFYLGYCEGGFAERYLGDVQMLLVKPGWRPPEPSFVRPR